ncbi:fibrous sheath CABYR-binding protein-like [Haemorhous mexicanus]|uniref:fibrous sheath CABYR-binding protein-like n=1 Tax=Haemorhous mexicanus TaxID=30427 RepID=UPI0028BD87FB|nr:fibrous sheath CABYR-binding protein-like [Haemorhous mexicanus]
MEELIEVQAGHGGNTFKDPYGGLGPYLLEDRSMVSTCTWQKSNVTPQMDVEPQELPRACSSTNGCTEKAAECSQLLRSALLAEQSPASGNSTPWDTPVKELEEKGEEEEVAEAQAAGEWDSDLQNVFLSILKEAKEEEEVCALAGDPLEEGHSKLLLTSESEESSNFSASPLSGVPDEERAACWTAKHAALQKQLCMRLQIMRKKREELEKLVEEEVYAELFGDIVSSMSSEESPMTSSCDLRDASSASLEPSADPSVPLSPWSTTEDATAETQSYSELVSSELSTDLGSDSEDSLSLEIPLNELLEKWEHKEAAGQQDTEVESPLSIPPQDEEFEPSPPPPDSDLNDQGHSEPLPGALAQEAKGFAGCASPADVMDEAEAAGMEAGCAQANPPQERPCRDEPPAGACPVPVQPLAHSVPACPAGSAAVPQPPAPRPWRSMAKRARRALRRLFSFSCLRGQPEE